MNKTTRTINNLFKTCAFLLISLFIGCNSDDDDQNPEGNDPIIVDLAAAKLNDFQLSEVKYTNIEIRQPEIVDGVEKTSGEIVITTPAQSDNLSLSLAAVFYPSIKYNKGIDDLLESVKLSITSKIVK